MKTLVCQKCKRRKNINKFDRSKIRKTSRSGWCKQCKKDWSEKNRDRLKVKKAKYYRDNIETFRARSAEYRRTHKKEISETGKRYRKKNGKKIYEAVKRIGQKQAKGAVYEAVKSGKLPNLKKVFILCCDCGKKRATQWEHRDYNKRLAVDAVCQSCNILRGSAKYMNPENFQDRKCEKCETPIRWYNKSGLCKKHYHQKWCKENQ